MPTKLGQNFLKDQEIVQKIIASAELKNDDFVLEIGPGAGVLTAELAKQAGQVLAIEIDQNLIPALQHKFANQKNIKLINEDILKINLPDLLTNSNYKVIANIPYYITSRIIRLFLETANPPQEMILMIQKEVAERIVARPGQMSILAVSVQYYASAKILFTVPRTAFNPAPEVDSAVIKITRNEKQKTKNEPEVKKFFRIVKAGFSAKRKTLANNLSASLHLDKKEVEEKLKTLGLRPNVRAQELSVEDWKALSILF